MLRDTKRVPPASHESTTRCDAAAPWPQTWLCPRLKLPKTRHCVSVAQDPAARLLVSTATLLADVQLPGYEGGDAGGRDTAVRRAELLRRLEPHLSR